MKKIWIVTATLLVALSSSAQEVLFSVNGNEVSTEEFVAVYQKNKGIGESIDPKTPQEYLDLYINFKLKIAEALEQKRDTAPSFKREFSGYRAQLAKPYLSDQNVEELMVREAYERLGEEINASHIMFALPADALPADTLRVYNSMLQLRKQIISDGKLTFEAAASKRSDDTWSAERGGSLGWFTAFNMVYPFENAAYNTAVGEISMPIRSQFGYHLVKVNDRRPASGKVKVRHLFFVSNENTEMGQQQRAQRSAEEVYRRLNAGESFEQLVHAFSEDRKTNKKGGELPAFGINEMMPEFESAAFALEQPGDFSQPIKTSIGWHIIQLVEKQPLASFESLKGEITQKVKRDSRSDVGASRFVKRIKKEYELEVLESWYNKTVQLVDIDAFKSGTWQAPALKRDRTVVRWNGGDLTQSMLLEMWSKNQRFKAQSGVVEHLRSLFMNWVDAEIIAYEDSKLEEKYPDFKNLVREYKEGILLFDITQDEVWNKAAKDSAGIALEYERIKNEYRWEDRIDYNYWVCSDMKHAKKIAKWIAKGQSDKVAKLLAKEDALDIISKNGLSQQGDNALFTEMWSTQVGVVGPVELASGKYGVLQVNSFVPSAPKALNEIRGIVIASYQNRLEAQWVSDLKAKYEVKIDKEVAKLTFEALN